MLYSGSNISYDGEHWCDIGREHKSAVGHMLGQWGVVSLWDFNPKVMPIFYCPFCGIKLPDTPEPMTLPNYTLSS
jgi:hypothetical protein